jgi:uncharacterized protein (TIGR00255 family)
MKSMTGYGRVSNRSQSTSVLGAEAERQTPVKGHGKSATVARGKALRLMTALEEKKAELDLELDVSVRAVNGRYLEMRFHLPREYAGLESDFKALITKTFTRGTLDIYVNRGRGTAAKSKVQVNTELAREWLDGYKRLGKTLKLNAKPTLELLTRVPEVFHVEEISEASQAEKALVFKLLGQALAACDQERVREGKALSAELDSLCARLEKLGIEMEALKAEATAELEKRYRERLQKLGFEGNVDDQRIAQEIVMQLDRADVSEELARLREHLKAYRQLLKSEEPQGKKLDFYAQELLREVNTIGSKSHIARLTALVVDAKTVVEKVREQVQNVE